MENCIQLPLSHDEGEVLMFGKQLEFNNTNSPQPFAFAASL